jgi:hypothetical protein
MVVPSGMELDIFLLTLEEASALGQIFFRATLRANARVPRSARFDSVRTTRPQVVPAGD